MIWSVIAVESCFTKERSLPRDVVGSAYVFHRHRLIVTGLDSPVIGWPPRENYRGQYSDVGRACQVLFGRFSWLWMSSGWW